MAFKANLDELAITKLRIGVLEGTIMKVKNDSDAVSNLILPWSHPAGRFTDSLPAERQSIDVCGPGLSEAVQGKGGRVSKTSTESEMSVSLSSSPHGLTDLRLINASKPIQTSRTSFTRRSESVFG